MLSRILKRPLRYRKSFFLLGPRGVGKTCWIKQNLPDAIYLDLLDTEVYVTLLANPGRILDFIPKDYDGWIVIDEVQRIPELLNEVHRLIERDDYVFVLTGSSARSLRKKGVNLLAGRALIYHMHPLLVQELDDQFDLDKALMFGMLPAIISEPDPRSYLKAYVSAYLREEVVQEGLTRNLAVFTRFLEAASFSQGQILNMAVIARECGTSQKNVSNYFDVLDDLLIGYRLPAFNKRAKRQTVQHPKFYFFDAGVYQVIRPKDFADEQSRIDGVALETIFLQSLRAINDYYDLEYRFYYWRTKTGMEVDFIVYGPQGFFAFEIKKSKRVNRMDAKGLLSFKEEFHGVSLFLIYGGEKEYYFGDVKAVPISKALSDLPAILGKELAL
ncbi:MAG: ATP-binding protein [Gammaproteobacteria bacterium]|nr:ATP-binding protein [Gammaproteobacteria bacterium]